VQDIHILFEQMTLREKASFCSGRDFWHLRGLERLGIPSIMVTDGPHGLRKQIGDPNQPDLNQSVPATCFPTASALAATWNRDLIFELGAALGEECRQEKVGVILGPGANIKRSPLCGRNFEYFSEDPYLTGEMAKSWIQGVQSQGIGTSVKHYAANNQETRRMMIDTLVGERALHEIYLAGFEIAIRQAAPWTIMCAYNRVNGTFASDHPRLMRSTLRESWGYQGLVMSDWGAMNDRLAALEVGVDLEMPGPSVDNTAIILRAIESGQLDEEILDRTVERILMLIDVANQTLAEDFQYDAQAHHTLARRVAGEGAVLLKNDRQVLPLEENARVALIGRFAKYPRYQGAGSSQMNPTQLDTLFDELGELVGEDRLKYAAGYTPRGDETDEALIEEALCLAQQADVVVVCAGLTDLYEIEGLDRKHMRMPAGHNALIERVAAAHPNVVVVLSNGSPIEMPWVERVPAILEGHLGGQAGAGALADILTGKVNPSGKLAETFPLQLSDTPAHPFPGGPETVEYRESIYVGYRYYDTTHMEVLFPFGHGLTYTQFTYDELKVHPSADEVVLSFNIKNTGDLPGQEIAQVYVRDPRSTTFRPDKELKGFAKVDLSPGEETEVRLSLDWRAFAYYDTGSEDWVVEAGAFELLIGASSRDIRLSATVERPGQGKVTPVDQDLLSPYFNPQSGQPYSQADFQNLLGGPIPPNTKPQKGSYTLNTPIRDMQNSFIGRQLFRLVNRQFTHMVKGQEDTLFGVMMDHIAEEISLRVMLLMDDTLNRATAEALLMMINGHTLQGLRALIRSRFFATR
jgi:beta-glucosidase